MLTLILKTNPCKQKEKKRKGTLSAIHLSILCYSSLQFNRSPIHIFFKPTTQFQYISKSIINILIDNKTTLDGQYIRELQTTKQMDVSTKMTVLSEPAGGSSKPILTVYFCSHSRGGQKWHIWYEKIYRSFDHVRLILKAKLSKTWQLHLLLTCLSHLLKIKRSVRGDAFKFKTHI